MAALRHDKHFTLSEANKLLSTLTPLLVRIQRSVELHGRQLDVAISAGETARTNGKKHESEDPDALLEIEALTARVEDFGCVLRDHSSGLIDFPSILDGREVYLCWRVGESEVIAWHELEGGLGGRQVITEDLQFTSKS